MSRQRANQGISRDPSSTAGAPSLEAMQGSPLRTEPFASSLVFQAQRFTLINGDNFCSPLYNCRSLLLFVSNRKINGRSTARQDQNGIKR